MNLFLAFGFVGIALVFWGSWANLFKMARVRFELFFVDYFIGNALVGLCLLPYTSALLGQFAAAGSLGATVLGSSSLAGLLYACGTLLLLSAVDLAGMSLAIPLVLGTEFVFGVPFLMLMEGHNSRARTVCNAAGILAVLVALTCDHLCHKLLATATAVSNGRRLKRRRSSLFLINNAELTVRRASAPTLLTADFNRLQLYHEYQLETDKKQHRGSLPCEQLLGLRAQNHPEGYQQVETDDVEDAILGSSARKRLGSTLGVLAGLFFAIWPCLADFSRGLSLDRERNVFLTAEAFYVVFVCSAFIAALLILPGIWRYHADSASDLAVWYAYYALTYKAHALGILAGIMQGLGSMLTLEAAGTLGTCVAMSIVRCSPVVAALWGALVWGELKHATLHANIAFAGLILAFLLAVALLGLAGQL